MLSRLNKVINYQVVSCSICLKNELEPVIDLKETPIADAYLNDAELSISAVRYPLIVNYCNNCGHLQLSHHLPTKLLYENYTYKSSISNSLLTHFSEYALKLISRFELNSKSLVVDIGSNDGSFLKNFKEKKIKILGVDPAKNIANLANKNGITTLCTSFSTKTATEIVQTEGRADLITANNVFAHISDINEVVEAIDIVLSANGVFVFEVSYVPDILNKKLFDTIYHEHLFYYYLTPLVTFFNRYKLEIFDFDRIKSKGGSIRVYVRRKKTQIIPSFRVGQLLKMETLYGYNNKTKYKKFNDEIGILRNEAQNYFVKSSQSGLTSSAYGASATVTTLLHSFRLQEYFKYALDDNPLKQGLYVPGTSIKIYDPKYFLEQPTNLVCILAWIYAEQIMKNNIKFKEADSIFMSVLPNIEVY